MQEFLSSSVDLVASQAAEKVGLALVFGWRSGLPLR
jgi:hypothetical protein